MAVDHNARTVTVETGLGPVDIGYERLVVALGSTARMLPIPGLAEHALTFKDLGDAVRLRNHVIGRLELAEADPANAARYLCFVFVGAGYAGVEALAETRQLVRDAAPCFPGLTNLPQRWVLVDAGNRILGEIPDKLSEYTADQLQRAGVEVLTSSTLSALDADAITLGDGRRIPTDTVVWTAGVTARPLVRTLGLPVDEQGRIVVDQQLRVMGRHGVWALGDNARVPNAANPRAFDPPTCQHAVRQARAVVRSLLGDGSPYRYRSIGEGATLGRCRGIARVGRFHIRGRLGGWITRGYHLSMVPTGSRRARILADGLLSTAFRRDIVELGRLQTPRARS